MGKKQRKLKAGFNPHEAIALPVPPPPVEEVRVEPPVPVPAEKPIKKFIPSKVNVVRSVRDSSGKIVDFESEIVPPHMEKRSAMQQQESSSQPASEEEYRNLTEVETVFRKRLSFLEGVRDAAKQQVQTEQARAVSAPIAERNRKVTEARKKLDATKSRLKNEETAELARVAREVKAKYAGLQGAAQTEYETEKTAAQEAINTVLREAEDKLKNRLSEIEDQYKTDRSDIVQWKDMHFEKVREKEKQAKAAAGSAPTEASEPVSATA